MSHAPQGGQAPDQASSGRQTGAAVPPGQIIPKAHEAASHQTSHKQHGDTRLASVPDGHPRRVSQSPEAEGYLSYHAPRLTPVEELCSWPRGAHGVDRAIGRL
jgi:hypothetical protein